MDNQTREALEKLSETVNTEGWEVLSKDLEAKIEAIKEELTIPDKAIDADILKIAQGRILAYRDILSLPVVIKHTFAEDVRDQAVND